MHRGEEYGKYVGVRYNQGWDAENWDGPQKCTCTGQKLFAQQGKYYQKNSIIYGNIKTVGAQNQKSQFPLSMNEAPGQDDSK
jgi:hypothetical protein